MKDGLHVNVEEAEREMHANMQRMTVNPTSAHTTDSQVDDIIKSVADSSNYQAAATMGDLLDIGGGS